MRTERLVLRAPDAKDVADIFRILGDPRNVVHVPAGPHADLSAAERQLATWLAHWQKHGFGHWVVSTADDPDLPIGFGGVFWRKVDDWPETLHIGFCFDASAWSRGYASELAQAGVAVASRVEHPVLLGIVRPGNAASLRVLGKVGMAPIGTLDEVSGEAPSVVMGLRFGALSEPKGWNGRYVDGQKILAGDVVMISGEHRGTVVFCFDNDSYMPGEEGWSYLGGGVMIDTDFAGYVHYPSDGGIESIALIRRAGDSIQTRKES